MIMHFGHNGPYIPTAKCAIQIHTNTLTESEGLMAASSIPNSLPQAAPIRREGMKTPADTVSPYVQQARKK